MNSALVLSEFLNAPVMLDVIVVAPGFWTPRIVMHWCVASITTATPIGRIASSIAVAICLVRRSWTWSRREKVSAIRASLERPRTCLLGM